MQIENKNTIDAQKTEDEKDLMYAQECKSIKIAKLLIEEIK